MELDVQHETNTKKVIARLLREGWTNRGGGSHDVFYKEGSARIVVPRHTTLTSGVARDIAKRAGWTK
jgi:predicted RNA binding protein YcfA (HicA-like mRNA interferase family)